MSESSLKPMTPRRVKRRSGSRGAGSSVRRSRRSYRNNGYLASTASLPREPRPSRPTSAHSSYSNFHAARPASYHAPEPERELPPPEPAASRYEPASRVLGAGYDVAGPYERAPYERQYAPSPTYGNVPAEYPRPGGWEALPPPAPPYSARATPQAPGPPAYQHSDAYNMMP